LIVNQIIKEREEFNQKYQELEKTNDDLRLGNLFLLILILIINSLFHTESTTNLETIKESYINTINELTQELLIMKEELDKQTVDTDQPQSISKFYS
jgi:hypothetical protein